MRKKLYLFSLLLLGSTLLHAETYNGSCGDNLAWTLDTKTGVLEISGTGNMTNWEPGNSSWYLYRTYITSVIINNGVTNIGNCAFYNCINLSSVDIPDGVISIESDAFSHCYKLANIEFPNSLLSIGREAFFACSLTSITIPSNMTSIGRCVFGSCNKLTTIIVESESTTYDSRNNCNAVIETASNKLVVGCRNTIIPNTVTSIGEGAFEDCNNLVTIAIPNSVTRIENIAFGRCYSLSSISISNSVTSIGESAFYACGLKSVVIPSSVTNIGVRAFNSCNKLATIVVESENTVYDSRNNCNAIIETASNKLIAGCRNTRIPNDVTCIGEAAFAGCDSLATITIPNSVSSIEYLAFDYCLGLTSITIPYGVTNIEERAFNRCSAISNIYCYANPEGLTWSNPDIGFKDSKATICHVFDADAWSTAFPTANVTFEGNLADYISGTCGDNLTWTLNYQTGVLTIDGSGDMDNWVEGGVPWYSQRASITSVVINSGVTSIGDYAFMSCNDLASISIPNGVTRIGNHAFHGCGNLTTISIPNTVTSIGDFAFGWSSLTSLTIPNNVTNIGEFAVYGCIDLGTLTIGNSVTSIGEHAFSSCHSLTSITIPNSVTQIDGQILVDCSALNSIIVEANNTKYDSRNSCNAIIETATNSLIAGCKSTIIPNTVTSIKKEAFRESYNLTSITIPNSVSTIEFRAFLYCGLSYLEFESGITNIGTEAFLNCRNLTSVDIPSSVISIGDGAFSGCGLTSVTIPSSVTSVGKRTFSNCDDLASIVVEPGNTNYDSRDNCNAIIETETNVLIQGCNKTIIPNTVISIGDESIMDFDGLTSIAIPNSVTSIKYKAFMNCKNLSAITIPNNVTTIEDCAFYGCQALSFVTIGSGVNSIGGEAFKNCNNVDAIYCYANPEGLTWSGPNIGFKDSKATICHVFDADAWSSAFPTANVTFVGDLTLRLENDADNSGMISEFEDEENDVTLVDRTLYQDDSWNTLCLPFDIADFSGTPLEDATVKELDTEAGSYAHQTGLDGSTLYLNFKDATSITAGKPYIVKWASGSNIVEPTFSGVTISSTTPSTVSSDDGKVSFIGTYNPVALAKDDETNLFVGEDNKLHWPNVANYKINTCRAYFHINESGASAPERIVLNYNGENNATNLENIGEDAVEKFIRDGQIYIRRNGITYNALGTIIR